MKWNCQNCKYSTNNMDKVVDHNKMKGHVMKMKQIPYQLSAHTV